MAKDTRKQVWFRCTEELHRRVRIAAAEDNETITDIIEKAVAKAMDARDRAKVKQ